MGVLVRPEPSGHRDAVFGWWERGDRVLLVRNPRLVGGAWRGLWDLPGGTVREGEGLREALVREWREETSLEVSVGRLQLVTDGTKRRAVDAPSLYTWRAFVFSVEAEGEPRAGRGIDEVAWVDREEVAAHLDAPYHAPLRRFLAGELEGGYGEVAWIDPLPSAEAAARATDGADGLRRLLAIGALAAAGRADLVGREVEGARAAGVGCARIHETLLQVVPYAGFPRAIAAFKAAGVAPPAKDPEGSAHARGRATFDAVYGESAERVREGLLNLHPDLGEWTEEFAYGTVLARGDLTLVERELLAVSILTALGGLDDPLLGHMRAAVRLGASNADVEAAIGAVPQALGESKREAANALLARTRP